MTKALVLIFMDYWYALETLYTCTSILNLLVVQLQFPVNS